LELEPSFRIEQLDAFFRAFALEFANELTKGLRQAGMPE
jgi:hypothetical protein